MQIQVNKIYYSSIAINFGSVQLSDGTTISFSNSKYNK